MKEALKFLNKPLTIRWYLLTTGFTTNYYQSTMGALFTMTSKDVVVAHGTQANEQTTAAVAKHKDLYGTQSIV